MDDEIVCPSCGHSARRVIYLGLPMRLCGDHYCCTVFGWWSWVPLWLPVSSFDETGEAGWAFMAYTGSYPRALWRWLRGPSE